MSGTLYIAAKAPRAGLAKTRLGNSIGHEPAAALYKGFLRDLAARFADAPFECGWYVTPSDAWPEMRPLVSPLGEGRVLFQGEGDWTERQRELFGGAAGRGEDKVVLIASDSPHLTVEVVVRAFEELDRRDLVLGPTFDGGYYLGLAETVREMGKEATGDQNKVLVLHGDAHAQAIFETNQGGELMQAILERLQKYR